MAFIAYDNLLDSAINQSVLNSSALASGYSIESVADNKTHTGIKFANTGTNFITLGQMGGPPRKINTVCIMGGNFNGSVAVQCVSSKYGGPQAVIAGREEGGGGGNRTCVWSETKG